MQHSDNFYPFRVKFLKFRLKLLIPLLFCFLVCVLQGCFIARSAVGANFDAEQLDEARNTSVLETRISAAEQLAERLSKGNQPDDADMSLIFSQEMVNKAAKQFDSATGWIDANTSFIIKNSSVVLRNGSAIASLSLLAHNSEHNVDVDLVMDCLLALSMQNGKLIAKLEPFNIAPKARAGGFLSSLEDVIADIVKVKIATMGDYLPPMEFPVDFDNQVPLQESSVTIRNNVNMNIKQPARTIEYALQLKEVLFFDGKMLVSMNLAKIGVK